RRSARRWITPSTLALLHGHLDLAAHDALLQIGDARLHVVRDARPVHALAHVADAVLGEAEGAQAAAELAARHRDDRVEHGDVAALDHAGDHDAGHLVVLVGVDADRLHAHVA